MKAIRLLIAATVCICLSSSIFAGQDPIGWSMTGSLPSKAELNQSYSVEFTLKNNLPFTMPTALKVANNSTPSSEVTMEDGCSGLKLVHNQTCTVGLVLIPKTTGTKQLSIFIEYGKNKVQIPQPALTTQTPASGTAALEGIVSQGFQTAIHSDVTYNLRFTFKNNTGAPLSGLALSQSAGNSAGYTQTFTNCGSSLTDSCYATGSFTTSATSGPVKVGYTYTNGALTASPVTSTVVNNSSAKVSRTFTILNKCTQTVWFGFVGGAVNTNACKSNKDCGNGSTCNPAANSGKGECFYNNPTPTSNLYQLAQNASNTVPISDYGLQYVWSGNVAARTGSTCATGTCETADCASGGGDNACPVGRGFDQPASLAEFTLLRDSIDSYDISILNGTNVPVQITPTTNFTFNPNAFSPSEYNCGSPGKPTQTNGLGDCSWSFIPPAGSEYKYRYVKPESPVKGLNCTSDSPCTTPGTVCGLYFDQAVSPHTLKSYCGTLIGHNTPNQVCSFANTNQNVPNSGNNIGDPFFPCDSAISGGTGDLSNFTNWALYACKAQKNGDLGTCYNTIKNPPVSTPNCCGCVDWQFVPGVTVPSNTTTCVAKNTAWGAPGAPATGLVYPDIEWVKKACPTAYSYPFDDKASSFACMDILGSHTVNTVNYTITFCPG